MWHIFRCLNCGLGFKVGFVLRRSGWVFATYVVCAACGTCHRIQCKTSRSKPERDRPDCTLEAHQGPILVNVEVDAGDQSGLAGGHSSAWKAAFDRKFQHRESWILCHYTLSEPVEFGSFERIQGLECSHCHEVGTLVIPWDRNNTTCPHCLADSLQLVGSAKT